MGCSSESVSSLKSTFKDGAWNKCMSLVHILNNWMIFRWKSSGLFQFYSRYTAPCVWGVYYITYYIVNDLYVYVYMF